MQNRDMLEIILCSIEGATKHFPNLLKYPFRLRQIGKYYHKFYPFYYNNNLSIFISSVQKKQWRKLIAVKMISKIKHFYRGLGSLHNGRLLIGSNNQINMLIRNSFSTVVPKLSNTEQQALVAYFAFLYIVDFKPENYLKDSRSIQQRLSDRVHFTNFILSQVRKYHQFSDLSQISLTSTNINTVMNAFVISIGSNYFDEIGKTGRIQAVSCQITQQQKQLKADQDPNNKNSFSYYYRTVMFPTMTTALMLKKMVEGENLMISGDKGTGKTYTFLIYDHLSQFIINCRWDELQNNLQKEPFNSLLNGSYFYKIRQIFYLQALNDFQYRRIKRCFDKNDILKTEFIYSDDDYYSFQKSNWKGLAQYIHKIIQSLKNKNIESMIVIDELYEFFRVQAYKARQIEENAGQSKYSSFLQSNKVLQYFQNFYTQLIIIARDFKTSQLMKKRIERSPLFNFYALYKPPVEDLNINHIKMGFEVSGQIQQYSFFWFRLQQTLSREKIPRDVINKVRIIFQDVFGLPSTNGIKDNKFIQWNQYIFPMKISHYLGKPDSVTNLKNNITQFTIQKIKQDLLQLKEQCEKYQIGWGYSNFEEYINTSTTGFDKEIRRSILVYINQTALDIVQENRGQQMEKNHFKVSLEQIEQMVFVNPINDLSLKEHIDIVAKQNPFGFFDSQTRIMTVFVNPREYVGKLQRAIKEQLNPLIERNPILKQRINRRIPNYRKYLIDCVKNLFNYGKFCLILKIQGEKKKKRTEKFKAGKGQQFFNTEVDFNIICCFQNIFNEARKRQDHEYISAAPKTPKPNQFDSMFVRNQKYSDNIFEIVTIGWNIQQLYDRILVQKQSNLIQQDRRNSLVSLEEIKKLFMDNSIPFPQILNQSPFSRHHFFLFIKMMLLGSQPQGLHWRHIIVFPNSAELKAKYSHDKEKKLRQNSKLLFEGEPTWNHKDRSMKFSAEIAFVQPLNQALEQCRDLIVRYDLPRCYKIEESHKISPSWFIKNSK